MISKKIIISSLLLCAQSVSLFGTITKDDCKQFATGLSVGLAHGAINQAIRKQIEAGSGDSFEKNATKSVYYLITLEGTTRLQNNLIDIKTDREVTATRWGHGIGQFLGESISIEKNEYHELAPRFSLRLNSTLIWAGFKSIIEAMTSESIRIIEAMNKVLYKRR